MASSFGARAKSWLGYAHSTMTGTRVLALIPEKEKWHCFGCNAGGDAVSFVMRIENVCYKAALKMLGQQSLPRPPPPRPEIAWGKATHSGQYSFAGHRSKAPAGGEVRVARRARAVIKAMGNSRDACRGSCKTHDCEVPVRSKRLH